MPLSAPRFRLRWVATSAVVATLAACGGDNDDPLDTDASSDPVAKFVGTWETECYADSGASAWARADLRKVSADTLAGDVIAYAYVGSSCSGPAVRDRKVLSNLVATKVGSQTVAGMVADQFTGSSDQGNSKFLMFTNGSILLIGDPKSPEDANGFPTQFLEQSLSRMD